MKITLDHPASSYGIPVILNAKGEVMDYAEGIRTIRRNLALSTKALGAMCNVSHRTVESWEYGSVPSAAALNVMSRLPLDTVVHRIRIRRGKQSA
jgi:hypothetical protein